MGRKEPIKREINLKDLPKITTKSNYGKINWSASIGHHVYFIYDNIEGEMKILNYNKKYGKLTLLYNETKFNMSARGFVKCEFGKILNKYTSNFKYEIGQILRNDVRDLTLIDRKTTKEKHGESIVNEKRYKIYCNICGWDEGWIREGDLLRGQGCSCCYGRTAVLGINTIWDTDRWMCDLGISEEDAKTHTKCSNKKVQVICPDCGRVKNISIDNIYTCHTIFCSCSDNIPYPEKFMFSVLEQLNLDFKTQLTKTTFKWCNKYKYDFYFKYNDEQYIIETHGNQHYEDNTNFKMSLKEVQENDKIKNKLAIKNGGIKPEHYIVIDCRMSKLDWIKNNIINSNLSFLFDLNKKIDWMKCEEFTLSSRVKEACDYWNSGKYKAKEIAKIMKLDYTTILDYIKKGNELNLCYYCGVEEQLKGSRTLNKTGKEVEIFKNGISLGIFPSCAELSRKSEELFGVKLSISKISLVCNGKRNHHQGFTFKYTSVLTKEDLKEYREAI